jgi:hypothetical protein
MRKRISKALKSIRKELPPPTKVVPDKKKKKLSKIELNEASDARRNHKPIK